MAASVYQLQGYFPAGLFDNLPKRNSVRFQLALQRPD
jgi:hypothetical protein